MKKCLPIMAKTVQETLELIQEYDSKDFEMYEWRIDALTAREAGEQFCNLCDVWEKIGKITNKPFIITLRTDKDGGYRRLDPSEYIQSIREIINTVKPQYIDIQMNATADLSKTKMLINMAHINGIKTITSYHNFECTPNEDDIVKKFLKMHYIGTDVGKIAVWPETENDISQLMNAAKSVKDVVDDIIAISMGERGKITRINGDEIGSVINFVKPVGQIIENLEDLGQLDL